MYTLEISSKARFVPNSNSSSRSISGNMPQHHHVNFHRQILNAYRNNFILFVHSIASHWHWHTHKHTRRRGVCVWARDSKTSRANTLCKATDNVHNVIVGRVYCWFMLFLFFKNEIRAAISWLLSTARWLVRCATCYIEYSRKYSARIETRANAREILNFSEISQMVKWTMIARAFFVCFPIHSLSTSKQVHQFNVYRAEVERGPDTIMPLQFWRCKFTFHRLISMFSLFHFATDARADAFARRMCRARCASNFICQND